MDWNPLIATHAVAALYALALGPINILRRRRDRTHRMLGYTWAGAMYFSWLHGLSAFTTVTVSLGILAAVRRNTPRLLASDPLTAWLAAAFVLASVVSLYGVLKPRKRRRRPAIRLAVAP